MGAGTRSPSGARRDWHAGMLIAVQSASMSEAGELTMRTEGGTGDENWRWRRELMGYRKFGKHFSNINFSSHH